MLPTNSSKAKDQGCSPTSSNCVVWQGPDLDCIGVCKGDTISDVTYKMATELCTLMDMFDLDAYDLACLSIPNSETPRDFKELTQILINKICTLEGITPSTTTTETSDCPDNCLVTIASCFYYTNEQGDTITTMTLVDYARAIGTRVCEIVDDITSLQAAVETLQYQINGTATSPGARKAPTTGGLISDIEDLQNDKADISSLQYEVNSKTDAAAGIVYVTNALRAVENSLIGQTDATGNATALYQNIVKAGLIDNEDRVFGTGLMSGITGWTVNAQTAAASLGNLWLAVRDLRSAVDYIQENCCSTGCSSIWLNFRAQLTGSQLTIYTDGSTGFSSNWIECNGSNTVTVTDIYGNSTTFNVSLLAVAGSVLGYTVELASTSVDFTTDLKVETNACFENTTTNATCTDCYEYNITSTAACPSVILTVYSTAVNYQFTATTGYSYVAKVYYNGASSPVASQIINTPGTVVLNSISGLLSETDYEFELVVVNSNGEETVCPKQPFTTLGEDCIPPINSSAILTI